MADKIHIYSCFDLPPFQDTEPGNPIRVDFCEDYSSGHLELKPCGETDIQAIINSAYEQSLIYNIIDRALHGDTSALGGTQGVYADISQMPKSIHEAMFLSNKARSVYQGLTKEQRDKFNGFQDFLSKSYSDDFVKLFVPTTKDSNTTTSEVTSDE